MAKPLSPCKGVSPDVFRTVALLLGKTLHQDSLAPTDETTAEYLQMAGHKGQVI